jgi:hypothetical protein
MCFRNRLIAVCSFLFTTSTLLAQSDSTRRTGFNSGPRSYTSVITSKAITKNGLFIIHKVDEKYFFEIPENLLGRDLLIVARLSKSAADLRSQMTGYAGDQINEQVIRLEKGPNNKLFLIKPSFTEQSKDSTMPMYQAVINSNIQPIAYSFDIRTTNPDTKAIVIDFTDYINGDNELLYFNSNVKSTLRIGGMQSDKSYVVSVNSYPLNAEIKTVKTYSRGGGGQQGPGSGGVGIGSSGNATVELNTSIVLLPEKPMQPRYADDRVGYFTIGYTDFDKDPHGVERVNLVKRWRLEPKDEAAYKKGELVEPKKPIVFYIDPATPKKWIPFLKQGVNDWQIAFEKAGFKNAIYAREAPSSNEDSTWSLEDARFSAIVYKPSTVSNASGPSISDPRSGEILESHINWYHNIMELLHNWYFIQTAAVDTAARTMQFSDELMGQLIRAVCAHEVGHTLGLRHNFGASSTVPVDSLRSKTFLQKNGHTPSIMDYARFNYIAQPEDGITQSALLPRIGEYDKWAIEWGYKLFPHVNEPDEEIAFLNQLTIARNNNSIYWFGSELEPDDPRSQDEDLGDNAMKASTYGIKNLQRIVTNLPEWTKVPNEGYSNLARMYREVQSQYQRYIEHVLKNIGGIYGTQKTVEQKGAVYEIVPKPKQKEAIAFLNKQVFATPTWLINPNINSKIGGDPMSSIGRIQERTLSDLLSGSKLMKLISAEAQFGNKAYTITNLYDDLQNEIWKELSDKKIVDIYRRNLQKMHLTKLIDIIQQRSGGNTIVIQSTFQGRTSVGSAVSSSNSDIVSITKANLKELKRLVSTALPLTTDKMTRYHLQDCMERINEALNPK